MEGVPSECSVAISYSFFSRVSSVLSSETERADGDPSAALEAVPQS